MPDFPVIALAALRSGIMALREGRKSGQRGMGKKKTFPGDASFSRAPTFCPQTRLGNWGR
jgi:hypothetical protein